MKSIYKLIAGSLFALLIVSCGQDPMEKEQYEKEIYLVGAYDRVWAIDVMYSEQPVENFFTISSSGTLDLDTDVNVSLETDDAVVTAYNNKFLGELFIDKFFEPMDKSVYDIPSLDNITIKHKDGISVNVPIYITSKELDIDKHYAIPLQINSCSPYKVNESGRKMLIQLKLKNIYSGNYQLDGQSTVAGEAPRKIQKAKVITATGVNTIRVFHAMNNESDKKPDIATKTIELTVSDEFVAGSDIEKKVSVQGWTDLDVTDEGVGTYNTVSKVFHVIYTVTSTNTKYEEILTPVKPIQ